MHVYANSNSGKIHQKLTDDTSGERLENQGSREKRDFCLPCIQFDFIMCMQCFLVKKILMKKQ